MADDEKMSSTAAAEYIGVALSSLQRANRTGTLFGLKAPAWEVVRVKSVKRILYSVADLDRWKLSHLSRPRKPRKKAVKAPAETASIQCPADGRSVMTFSAEHENCMPLLVKVRHRTYLRAINLHHTICAKWRYSPTAEGRILLRVVVDLPDGEAGYCHLADDTPAALGVAAEDLVITLWRAVKKNPDAASAVATAARASIGPGAPEPSSASGTP